MYQRFCFHIVFFGLVSSAILSILIACDSSPSESTQPSISSSPLSTTMPTVTNTSVPSTETLETSTRYELTFEATWSEETHPTDFPSNPHFSGLIGAAHSSNIHLWQEGEPATPGIKSMAETGSKSPLNSEVGVLIGNGDACIIISGGGINPSPGMVTVTFVVNQDCPMVSIVSMIAPSPDWFIGVSGVNLYENGEWMEQKVVDLFPYDAGTDSGASYASPNKPTDNPEGIYRINTDPLVVNEAVPPLGTFTFNRLDD